MSFFTGIIDPFRDFLGMRTNPDTKQSNFIGELITILGVVVGLSALAEAAFVDKVFKVF